MQQKSFFMGCNYSNRVITDATTGWSLYPVQDIDTVLANRYGVNVDDAFSLMYHDLYHRQLKEDLKHTMLVHESVFGSQIHELHRLYQRQKELMMEMDVTRQTGNSGFTSPSTHWMSSSISYGENIPNLSEVVDKSEKKVLDLELPVFEYNVEERGFTNGKVDQVPNFLKEQSSESGNQSSKLQLDLNEPAKIEEHSDYVFNQFLSPTTSNEIGEVFDKKNEGEDEVEGQPLCAKCQGGYGIDLNVSLLSMEEEEEEVTIVKKFETEKPREESLSVSLHGKQRSEQPRVIVQALPCSNSILLLGKRYKPLNKVKLGPSNKTYKGSDLDPHSSAQATSESQCNQASMEKGCSSFLSKVIPAKKRTNLGKKRPREQRVKSSHFQNVVAKKSGRTKRKKSRRLSLVDIFAAEALVDISRKSGRDISEFITSLSRNLLWFAEISSLVAEDYEIDDFEAMTLHLSLEEQKMILRLKSADDKTAVSSIVRGRQRRSRTRQGKRKYEDDHQNDNRSLGTFSECEANEDLQVIEKVTEASEPIDAFVSLVEENLGVDWGVIKKRRRGSRIPATDFQRMIINQVVEKPN